MDLCGFLFVTGRPCKDPGLKHWIHLVIWMCIHTGKQAGSALPVQAKGMSKSQPEKFVGVISFLQPELPSG